MTNRSYPRWSKHGHSELFYPHKNRWIFEVHHHSDGRFVALGKDLEPITFTTAEEAKQACEAKYEKEHARKVFDFRAVPRRKNPQRNAEGRLAVPRP